VRVHIMRGRLVVTSALLSYLSSLMMAGKLLLLCNTKSVKQYLWYWSDHQKVVGRVFWAWPL